MKAFLPTNTRSDAEPLLSTANITSSSDELLLDNDGDDVVAMNARNKGGGMTILTTLLSPFQLVPKSSSYSHASTTSSTAPFSPDNRELSLPLSPQQQQQQQQQQHSPNEKFQGQIIISKQQQECEHGRRFASYRQHNNHHHSPMPITPKKKRVGNTSLPASRSSPLLTSNEKTFINVRVNETCKSDNDTSDDLTERKLIVLQQQTQLRVSPGRSAKKKDKLLQKEKITLIDLDDEVSCDSSCALSTTDDEISPPRRRGGRNSRGHHSAPSNRLDSEKLLSQMGMDVSEEDYCIEGEFEKHRSRCHSYDCNYKQPLDDAYEDFGVERRLVVLNPPRHAKNQQRNRRESNLAKSILEDVCERSHEEVCGISNQKDSQPAKSKTLSNVVFSILRVGGGSRSSRHNRKGNVSIPQQIVAPITPTSSDDDINYPLTPEENCLFIKWQMARIRNANVSRVDQPVPKKKNCEDLMSISASSCGDKTAPIDNRRHHLRQGFSF